MSLTEALSKIFVTASACCLFNTETICLPYMQRNGFWKADIVIIIIIFLSSGLLGHLFLLRVACACAIVSVHHCAFSTCNIVRKESRCARDPDVLVREIYFSLHG